MRESFNNAFCFRFPFYLPFQEVKGFHSIDQLNEFMLGHGENIVDIMGDEIDRIEMNLSVSELFFYYKTHFEIIARDAIT